MSETNDSMSIPVELPTVIDPSDKLGSIGSPEWSSQVRKRAKALVRQLDTGYMELAELLYRVYDTPIGGDRRRAPIFKSWGFSSFAEWVREDVGIGHYKAHALLKIWYVLEVELKDLEPKVRKRLVHLGWSKMKELSRVLTLRNAEEWAEKAERFNCPCLAEAIAVYWQALSREATAANEAAKNMGEEGDPVVIPHKKPKDMDVELPDPDRWKSKVFHFQKSHLDNVNIAIELAGTLSDSVSAGVNLDLICTDFLATNDFRKDPDRKAYYIARIERAMGVKIIAFEGSTLIYGGEHLAELAKEEAS